MQITGIPELDELIYEFDGNSYWKSILIDTFEEINNLRQWIYDKYYKNKTMKIYVKYPDGKTWFYTKVFNENLYIFLADSYDWRNGNINVEQ